MKRCCGWMIVFLLTLSACKENPSSPDPYLFYWISVTCLPAGINVTCSALLISAPTNGSTRDVTSEATWLVSDPALGSFVRPGLFSPSMRGEVGLWARYEQWEEKDISWFLVDPASTAQRLYFLAGNVRDKSNGNYIVGAEVQMLDGYKKGAQEITNENGYYMIDRILTGETFSVRASREGYAPCTQSYRVDSPIQPAGSLGNSPFLDFYLQRL